MGGRLWARGGEELRGFGDARGAEEVLEHRGEVVRGFDVGMPVKGSGVTCGCTVCGLRFIVDGSGG